MLEHGDFSVRPKAVVSDVKHQTAGGGRRYAGRLRQRQALTCHQTVDASVLAAKKRRGRSSRNRRNGDGPSFHIWNDGFTVSLSSGLRATPWMSRTLRTILRFCEVSRRGPTGLLKEHNPCRSQQSKIQQSNPVAWPRPLAGQKANSGQTPNHRQTIVEARIRDSS